MAFIYTLSYRRLAVQIKLLLLRRGRLSERGKVARGGIVARRSFCYPSDAPRQLQNATDAWHPCRAHADLLQ